MSLNNTPSSERIRIGFFGMRNAGKSSLVNSFAAQAVSLVSDVKGTTTDPVKKAMELLPLGPVLIIDTPGIDDEGALGKLRIEKTLETLKHSDLAVLVIDSEIGQSNADTDLISLFKKEKVPYLIVYNKCDKSNYTWPLSDNEIEVSALNGTNIDKLKEKIIALVTGVKKQTSLLDDILSEGDTVVLVTPIDEAAPKGRLILPQQLVLRNILDNNCTALVCKETQLKNTLESLKSTPGLVITDSQVFSYVDSVLPRNIRLTSFSVLMARYKGDLKELVKGAATLKELTDGDKILISEGCTHHRQCNDIGTVKLPAWIRKYTDKKIDFDFSSGSDFPGNLKEYTLVVHCGGCMLSDKEMKSRIDQCKNQNIPIVNYGVAIAMMNGILERSLEIFPHELGIINSGD